MQSAVLHQLPFLLSTQGYGLFVNTSSPIEWEIGPLNAFSLGFAVKDRVMDYFVIHGPTPAEILQRYSELTGFSPVELRALDESQ